MAVVGGSEAEPVEWCGPPKSQTHQRSALFLYNGKTKTIGQLNFSPVAPILVQMSTSPTNPRMGWGPWPWASPSGLLPPQGWSLRRPLLLTATSCRPKTAGIPPLASSGNKRTDLSFAEPGIPHSPLVSPAHGSLQPEISKRGIPAAFEGLSSRVMGTGDRWEGGGAVFLGQLTWWPTHNWSQTRVWLLCNCNQGWRHFCNTIIWNGFPDAFYFPPRCGTNSPIANTELRRGKKSWWNSTFKLICCF